MGGDDNAFPICALPTLRENTPQTLRAGVGFSRLFRLVKPPLRLKKTAPVFYSPLLQGVTHYTLQARSCARLSLWTPFRQGLRPASRRLRLREKAVPVTVLCGLGGYPITTVITVTTVTAQRTPAEKKKGVETLMPYAILRFQKRKAGLCGCL